jgi:hypothetical protein
LQRTRIEGIVVESIVARRLRRRNRARLHTARLRPRAEEVLEEAVVRRVGRAHCCVEAALLLLLLLRRLLLRALSRTQSGAGTNVIGTRDGVEAEHRVLVGHAACAGQECWSAEQAAEVGVVGTLSRTPGLVVCAATVPAAVNALRPYHSSRARLLELDEFRARVIELDTAGGRSRRSALAARARAHRSIRLRALALRRRVFRCRRRVAQAASVVALRGAVVVAFHSMTCLFLLASSGNIQGKRRTGIA